MGLVIIAGLIMTVLVLTGFRTAVFEAVPESLKTAIVAGIGFFIAFIGLVDSGIIRRMPDAAGTTVPVSFGVGGHLLGWPTLVFIFGLFLTIALFIRNVRGAILIGVVASTALSIILEAISISAAARETRPAGRSMFPRSIIFPSQPPISRLSGLHDSARSALSACWAHPCWCSLFCSRSSSTPWAFQWA